MSYYRGGYHGGRGGMMSNFGGGGNRFGILPVTRPMRGGGMFQNRPPFGSRGGNWNNFRGSGPRRK